MQIAIVLSALVLGALVVFGLLFPGDKPSSTAYRRERRNGKADNPFHAVSIHPASQACSAVEGIKAQRFLSEEAPGLPLPGCLANCHCKYVHHADRRGGARDRRLGNTEASENSGFWGEGNRRKTAGRRHSDLQLA